MGWFSRDKEEKKQKVITIKSFQRAFEVKTKSSIKRVSASLFNFLDSEGGNSVNF